MGDLISMKTRYLYILLLSACMITPAPGQDSIAQLKGLQPVFHFSASSAEPVIEYNLVHGMLASPDPVPLLRIYGDGRAHVHIPAYMKGAGDFELLLKPAELNNLLRQLADNGIVGFDHAAVMQEKHRLEASRRAATGEMFYISDATDTVINIRLEQYQRTQSSPRIVELNEHFSWRNLRQDARRFPASSPITRAAAAANMLNELCTHPGLQRLP